MRRLNRTRIICESDRQLLLELKDLVTEFVSDAELILYGSVARGKNLPDSDYDVLILTKHRLSSEQQKALDGAIYDLQLKKETVLSVMIYTYEQWRNPIMQTSPYRKNVIKEGIVV